MNFWAVPSSSGDYRLTTNQRDPNRSVLTVVDPTDKEMAELTRFLTEARGRNWAKRKSPPKPRGTTRVDLDVPIGQAGPLLVTSKMPDRCTLTCVTSAAGEVVAIVTAAESGDAHEADLSKAADKAPKGKAATVRRGTVCCPSPVPGPIALASRVLRLFSTPTQWRTWVKHAYMDCIGGATRRTYRVYHRHHPHAVALRQPILDLDYARYLGDRARLMGVDVVDVLRLAVLHRWDYTVPAPEEVLAAKLILENREAWIRNASGACQAMPEILPNPVGAGHRDGLYDTRFFSQIGIGWSLGVRAAQRMMEPA